MDLKYTPPVRKPVTQAPRAKISGGMRRALTNPSADRSAGMPLHADPAPHLTDTPDIPPSYPRYTPDIPILKIRTLLARARARIGTITLPKTLHRHPNFHSVGPVAAVFALLAVFGVAQLFSQDFYTLPKASQAVIGPVNQPLSKKLIYNKKADAFQYNAQAEAVKPNSPQAALAAAQKAQTSQKVGGGADNYSASLAAASAKGVDVTDTTDTTGSLGVKLTPQFKTREGKLIDGRVIYPVKGKDAQLVYSVKANGLKEDLVIPEEQGDTANFTYKLELPDSLQARLLPNGNIGVFSADTALFGNISYGSDADRAKVEAARKHGIKNHLAFIIPAPVISQSGKGSEAAKAEFALDDDVVTVKATGLAKAGYPLSIDPSIVVTSANDFATGNNEGGIEFDTSNGQIKRGAITGGTVGSWTQTRTGNTGYNGFNNTSNGNCTVSSSACGSAGSGVVAYNGFLYVTGGAYNNHGSYINTVSYATITNGAIGTWTLGTSFATARAHHGSFIYNGYLYVVGGVGSGSTDTTSIQYARINTDGSVGSWASAGASLPTAIEQEGVVANNGFMYVLGGFASGSSSNVATVQYAAIKADGTISTSWTTSTALPNAQTTSATVYNNTIYVVQTCKILFTCSSSPYSIQYIEINNDGSLGATWHTTTTPLTNVSRQTIVASAGYLYMVAGYNGSVSVSEVEYAPINADGSLGNWVQTSTLVAARHLAGTTVYNGYVYIQGGYNDASSSQTSEDTQYAKINPAGATGNYTTSGNTFTNARSGHTSVAYNGYLYVAGGSNLTDVYYAPINGDGTIGTWTSTTAFATGRQYHAMVAYNGFMYILGGTNGTGQFSDVQYIAINANGSLAAGPWSTGTSLPASIGGLGAVVYGGYIYITGGFTTSVTNNVYSVPINANGSIGTWSSALNSFTTGRWLHSTVVAGGYLFVMGGSNGGTTLFSDIQSAKINSNGTIGSWSSQGNLPSSVARDSFGAFESNGYLYVSGGCTVRSGVFNPCTTLTNNESYAVVNADGSLGSWVTATSFATTRCGHQAVAYRGYVYVTGGASGSDCSGTAQNNVEIAPIGNGGTGNAGSWGTATAFPSTVDQAPAVAVNGYLYVLGGCTAIGLNNNIGCASGSVTNVVKYAAINPDGTLGSWGNANTGAAFTARYGHAAVAYNGYMYVLGGCTSNGNFCTSGATGTNLNDVYSAQINSNGTLGAWSSNTAFSSATARYRLTAVTYNGYIYILGGVAGNSTTPTYLSDVWYASIGSTGTLGTWTSTTAFTTGRYSHTSIAYNGNIYVMGGCSASSVTGNEAQCSNFLADVQYAPLNSSNGTVGSWTTTTAFATPRYGAVTYAANGYVYVSGGCVAGGGGGCATTQLDTQYAAINGNGALGSWVVTSNAFTGKRMFAAGAAYNGRMYMVGGIDSSMLSDTPYMGQQATAREGTYSYLSDLGGDAAATKLVYKGAGANNSLSRKSALSSSGVFGSSTNISNLVSGALNPLSGVESRYRLLSFTLDDSQSAVFPDVQSNTATITDIELYYHAASGTRLRGGKSFTGQGAAAGLDAQP